MAESVVTKARRTLLAQITSGEISSISPITFIAVGDGGVDDSGEPKFVSEEQTQLFNELQRFKISKKEFPTPTTVRYTVEIEESELVGAKISEAGILDGDGVLCAIKTMYAKTKDADVKFTFEFEDQF